MRLRLDPWAIDYDTAMQAESEGTRRELDLQVERPLAAWQPIRPATVAPQWDELVFMDGSRRLEARLLLEDGDRQVAFGALGSSAVGAVRCAGGRRAEFVPEPVVERHLLLTGGQTLREGGDQLLIERHGGWLADLSYRVRSTPEPGADAVVRALQRAMLEAEGNLASRLTAAHPGALLICDGPRPLLGAQPRVVGYLKTIHELRLEGPQLGVVRSLEQGERSPLYLVVTGDPQHQFFEWFLRLRDPRPWYYTLAGMVRLQAYAGPDPGAQLEWARTVADWSCLALPGFASRAHQDPRAPQQLLPVRALETELRRRMGHPQLVRRRIARYLVGQEVEAR